MSPSGDKKEGEEEEHDLRGRWWNEVGGVTTGVLLWAVAEGTKRKTHTEINHHHIED